MDHPQSTSAQRACTACGTVYPRTTEYWHQDGRTRDGLHNICRPCRNQQAQEYHARTRAARSTADRVQARQLRRLVLTHYGSDPPCCVCCGEAHWEFLALDHINGGGFKHRTAVGGSALAVYRWIIKQGYPPDFRVLCHNCNMALAFYKVCPHERERLALAAHEGDA